jgi:nucleoside-diphosphate-sugar epimerase
MDVVIAGGHGKIALRLAPLLQARGDRVRALIRNPGHAGDVRAAGAEPVVCDLEHAGEDEVAQAIAGADAVVFAAGAGPAAARSASGRWTTAAPSSSRRPRARRARRGT